MFIIIEAKAKNKDLGLRENAQNGTDVGIGDIPFQGRRVLY